jgi:hypothetical protein
MKVLIHAIVHSISVQGYAGSCSNRRKPIFTRGDVDALPPLLPRIELGMPQVDDKNKPISTRRCSAAIPETPVRYTMPNATKPATW